MTELRDRDSAVGWSSGDAGNAPRWPRQLENDLTVVGAAAGFCVVRARPGTSITPSRRCEADPSACQSAMLCSCAYSTR